MSATATQPDLFPPLNPEPGTYDSIAERFAAFDEANPQVFAAIVRECRRAKAQGVTRAGMKAIFEHLRWESKIKTRGESEWRLNNNYAAFYARKVMDEHPEFEGFFETRGETRNGRD